MNYNVQMIQEPASTFASRFTLPLWQYVVPPRAPEDGPYVVSIDFAEDPYYSFAEEYVPLNEDVLEIFELRRRVLLTGVQIEIVQPAQNLIVRPVTNSGIVFNAIDCSTRSRLLYAIDGGMVDRTTDLEAHSVLVDDPDYFGLRIESGSIALTQLEIRVELAISDEFKWSARTNYNRP